MFVTNFLKYPCIALYKFAVKHMLVYYFKILIIILIGNLITLQIVIY